MVVGETHHFRKHPNSFQLQVSRNKNPRNQKWENLRWISPQLEILSADEARLDPILRVPWQIWSRNFPYDKWGTFRDSKKILKITTWNPKANHL